MNALICIHLLLAAVGKYNNEAFTGFFRVSHVFKCTPFYTVHLLACSICFHGDYATMSQSALWNRIQQNHGITIWAFSKIS